MIEDPLVTTGTAVLLFLDYIIVVVGGGSWIENEITSILLLSCRKLLLLAGS